MDDDDLADLERCLAFLVDGYDAAPDYGMTLSDDEVRYVGDHIKGLRAEVARYREALKKIARCTQISPQGEERPSYEANIAIDALTPAAQPDTAPQPDRPAMPKPGPGSA